MLTMRLQRTGKRNRPTFRLVVTEHTNGPKSGRFLEIVGNHDRLRKETQLKRERIEHWLAQGVRASGAVHNLLVHEGIMTGEKIAVHSLTPGKKKAAAAAASAAEEKKREAEKPANTENAEHIEESTDKENTKETSAPDAAETNTPEINAAHNTDGDIASEQEGAEQEETKETSAQ